LSETSWCFDGVEMSCDRDVVYYWHYPTADCSGPYNKFFAIESGICDDSDSTVYACAK
jgi:hypothetical protein